MLMPLDIEKKELILAMVEKLAKQVESDLEMLDRNGLLSGLAGHLLFLFRAANFNDAWVDEEKFHLALDKLQNELAEQTPELSSGLAGQAWVLEYFNQYDDEDYDPELLEEIDHFFATALDFTPWTGEIEMVLGLAGYSPYISRRAKRTKQSTLFDRLVTGYESVAVELSDQQIAWSQPKQSVYRFDKEDTESHEFNLGLAHGVPGIIAALLPALQDQKVKLRAQKLVIAGCDWLLEQQSHAEDKKACFGSCAGDEHHSRLGWCYGDLTIALTLARAGHALDKPRYVEQALEIALFNVDRDATQGHIKDAGLCHGFFGLVTIYQLLNQIMPHPKLQGAALTWLDYGLNQYQERGLEALYSYNGLEKAHQEDHSFLMGYSGIGLALIGVLDDNLDWVDCLLMS
ncbi:MULTISPECIES: lanthionine synthetase C family protein [unclassified Pseudoalteromonas]|uniref:lanthionine synthetase C family protein n=1 Tax=unclassified Pseudoalteromonas TaxID=194690 RepID=UPI001F1B27AB|nr:MULTISPECIES: lanthionine synthetase C family protein [unclassified Pseudoalteromonas]MCF2828733.1 lanthionine synthetase C family protein [Pseudoalteromonas sp. OF5H-5]MCF2830776.1 lanthionine synthetase C family protein [Pseudoalteromonas sp. DL2-H6]MCF2925095.1 lanthionine synthetase C family protein [Pseudoalteromonas sp. DL2-H1]